MAPPAGDGVTSSNSAQLRDLLDQAGFSRAQIFAVSIRPFAAAAYKLLHEFPLSIYRHIRKGDRDARPQTYEATWAFQQRLRLNRYKLAVHSYWQILDVLLRLGGDVFQRSPAGGDILGKQSVVEPVSIIKTEQKGAISA